MNTIARSAPLCVEQREAGGIYSSPPTSAARHYFTRHPLFPPGNLRPCETVSTSVRVAQRENAGRV